MAEIRNSEIQLTPDREASLLAGARDVGPVRGLTHGFYKYPGRFSPAFARAAIEAFTQPGDLVLDPHVGGGTSVVEALATGRDAIGVDISSLAEFVTGVKTTIYSDAELDILDAWSRRLPSSIHARKYSIFFKDHADLGYYKHLDHRSRWRLRKAIEQGIGAAIKLGSPRMESFGRCIVLRVAQWALDGRSKLPSLDDFRDFLGATAINMVDGARALRAAVPSPAPMVMVIHRSAVGLEGDERLQRWHAPKLVLTSPPYPGVHMLYHRFQVDGRKEAPLPFMIAGKFDGAFPSYYTMGDRRHPALATYFANVKATMSSVVALADESTVIVQMVAFSDASWQLQCYIDAMEEVGLQECFLPALRGERDGRLWRSVPSRRWYSDQRGETPGSREVVLIHRKSESRRCAASPAIVRRSS
jgi:hypothetical protein